MIPSRRSCKPRMRWRKIMSELDKLCMRDDACEVVGQLLRQLDVVTAPFPAWTEVHTLH